MNYLDYGGGAKNFLWARGTSFRKKQAAKAEPGMAVTFEVDPENEHDANAIKILVDAGEDQIHIGFVPSELTKYVKPMLEDENGYWDAEVSRVVKDGKGIGVEVSFHAQVMIPRQRPIAPRRKR